jgi:hypothetical protein
MNAPTAADIAAWPVTVDAPTAGRALGLGREASYRAAAAGELPGAIRVGRRWRVITARLAAALGIGGTGPPGREVPPGDDFRAASSAERSDLDDDETSGSLLSIVAEGGDDR